MQLGCLSAVRCSFGALFTSNIMVLASQAGRVRVGLLCNYACA